MLFSTLRSLFTRTGSRTRRRHSSLESTQQLESRALLTVMFQFEYAGAIGSGIGFEDATDGQARRDALETAALRIGSIFDHTATITMSVTSSDNAESDNLASAGTNFPTTTFDGFDNNEVVRTKILTGTDVNGATVDGSVDVNWGQPWELSSDSADISDAEFDYFSTIYHELLHSVGFSAIPNEAGLDLLDAAPEGQPGVWSYFDQFLSDASGAPIINNTTFVMDKSAYDNHKTEGASPSGGLFFNGPKAMAANGGSPVGLYTPATWEDGSSVAHLDDQNPALAPLMMTSATDTGPGAQNLTVLERAVLEDLGYTLVTGAINVTQTGESTSVTEAGSTDTFDVVLNSAPLVDVVLNVSSSDTGEATVDQSILTFTNANWNIAQTVTVTGINDANADGNQTSTITLSVSDAMSDDGYDFATDATVAVTTIDDDTAGFTVTQSDETTSVSEARTTDAFDVVLTAQPASDVVLTVDSADVGEVKVDQATLTFTSANWNLAQTVTVTGIDDAAADGDQTTLITLSVDEAASDDVFDSLADQTVSVVTLDNETLPTPTLTSPSGGGISQNPTVEWQETEGAETYEIWINKIGSPNTIAFRESNISGTSFTLPTDLPAGAQYRVWVRAHTATTSSIYSIPLNFSVGVAPGAVELSAPTGNTSARPTFEWADTAGAETYDLWVNQVGGTVRIIREQSLTGTSFTASSDLPNGEYQAWLRSENLNGFGPWTTAPIIFTVGTPPTAPTVSGPTGTTGTRPIFEWTAVDGADLYELWVNQIGGTTRIIHETTLTATTFTATSDLTSGSYRTWVRAIDSSGIRGPWSAGVNFMV